MVTGGFLQPRPRILPDRRRAGRVFRLPTRRTARLFHAVTARRPAIADDRVTTVLESFFVRGENIATPKAISAIRTVTGLDGAAITAMIDDAVGSPFVVVDGAGVFGADRLPHIAWRLARARPPGDPRP